ncbi:hypothetical protein [Streptomyces sp. BH104]|uniref:hypothetical protein n=1 Tax=Streptomyces sp. BH104 TaxID=3410407 RepID=UPI003BB57250
MKDDLLAALDVYATGMQWAVWIWIASAQFLTAFGLWLTYQASRRIVSRIYASFIAAHGLVDDIQKPGEETP